MPSQLAGLFKTLTWNDYPVRQEAPPKPGQTVVAALTDATHTLSAHHAVVPGTKKLKLADSVVCSIISAFRLTLFGLSFALSVMPAVADGPPILNIGPSCSAAAEGAAGLGRNRQMCLDLERTALALLQKNWSQFSAAHKTQCVGLSARSGPQSYVELISCLETMTAADALHKTEPTDRAVAEIKPARTFVSGYSDGYSESPTITKTETKNE